MATSYRLRPGARAPAKDEDGKYMCDFSPYSHTVSPLLEHPKYGKQKGHPDSDSVEESAMAESYGSMPVEAKERAQLQQHAAIADAGSINAMSEILPKAQTRTQFSPADVTHRKPLQEANRDISAHPVRVSNTQGSSLTVPGKVSVSQQKSTAAFKEKHLKQMRAANERLEQNKVRNASVDTIENSNTVDSRSHVSSSQKRSSGKREVVQTHVNVSELISGHNKGQIGAKPSTEALLRAASMGQHGTGRSTASRVPRTSSMAKGKQNSEASKKVYSTLQSPNLDAAETVDAGTAPAQVGGSGHASPESENRMTGAPQQLVEHKELAPTDGHLTEATHCKEGKASNSMDSQRQSKVIPRSVAALANRFETKVTPGPAFARPTTGLLKLVPKAQGVPQEQSSLVRSGLPRAPSSGGRTGTACAQTPTQPCRQDASVTDGDVGEAGVLPADSSSVQQVPQDPRLQRKEEASAIKQQRHSEVCAVDRRPVSTHTGVASQGRVATPARPSSAVQECLPKAAAPRHAAAFGSPMHHGHADDKTSNVQPARDSVVSMSCNVNMASPTTVDDEVVSAWKQAAAGAPVYREGRENTECNNTRLRRVEGERRGDVAERQPLKETKPIDGDAKAKVSKKSSTVQAHAASPPTRAFSRLSDACTSPVDSLWRPMKKALVPQGGCDDDALMTKLLAPDGSPAPPDQRFAANSPVRSPSKARPATAKRAISRPSTAGNTRTRPATAGTPRTVPSRSTIHGAEAGETASESSSDQASRLLRTGPDRVHSVGSAQNGLEPTFSRGALELSAAHLRGSVANEEPFVDLMGVQVDSAYLKSGRSGASSGTGCCSIM